MFPSWWRNLVKLANRNGKHYLRGRKKTAKPRPSCRPTLEQFEERLVPTTVSIPAVGPVARGATVKIPINVDTLSFSSASETLGGLSGGSLVVLFNPAELSFASVALGTIKTPSGSDPSGTASGDGYSPTATHGWQVALSSVDNVHGYVAANVENLTGSGFVSGTGGGSLVVMTFSVLANAPLGDTPIDLAADTDGFGNSPITSISDADSGFNTIYPLSPQPIDNTGDLQTITFGGQINNGDQFSLSFSGGFNPVTTSPISYNSTPSILQNNIQRPSTPSMAPTPRWSTR